MTSWYRENCTKPPPIPMAPSAPKPLRMAPRQKFYAKITGPMTPRQKTSTELGLQRSSKVPGHFSEERFTPIIYEKTYDFPSRGYGDVKLQDWQHGGCLVETGLVSCHMVIFKIYNGDSFKECARTSVPFVFKGSISGEKITWTCFSFPCP